MSNALETEIVEVERRLQEAMLKSSVEELENLLADDLLFTNHMGVVTTKEADVSAHESGAVKIDRLEFSDRRMRFLGDVVVVIVRVEISGVFMGTPASGSFQFTRVWRRNTKGWQVVVGHSCLVA